MKNTLPRVGFLLTLIVAGIPMAAPARSAKARPPVSADDARSERGILWQDPTDIGSRDLYYGSGGKEHAPSGQFKFLSEDLEGTNPKIEISDQNGVKWKVKFGSEARPETAASRFVWAVGYATDEDYFVGNLKVEGLPARLKRGKHLLSGDGYLHNVRLERHIKGQEKLGTWRWKRNPFTGTREFNRLRVLMAVINNWDLKDQNTSIYKMDGSPEPMYMISDLGATFGTTGYVRSMTASRGSLPAYSRSKFITRVTPNYVDFKAPSRPTWLELATPTLYMRRVHFEWIGRQIPRADAKATGDLLGRLSPDQIRDAFRAAGYSSEEVSGFATVIQGRIRELQTL